MPTLITEEDNNKLISPFSYEEVYEAISGMGKDKALGPHGFPLGFFHTYWDIMGEDVTRVVQELQESDALLRRWNITFITLIPKV